MMQGAKEKEKEKERSRRLVNFRIDQKDYAVDINSIIEIISFREVTPVPRLPSFIEGVVDLRRIVIPVIDLKKRLGLLSASDKKPDHILIVKIHGKKIGIIVDEVREVIGIEEGSVQAPPDIFKDKDSEYLCGICRFKGRLILILDLEGLFSHEERGFLGEIKKEE